MEPLNWIAVIAGAVAAFLAGWAVYAPPVLGRVWARGSGVDLDGGGPGGLAFVTQIAALFTLALVIGITATFDALGTAILAILAAALFTASNGAFTGKSTAAMAIDGGYVIIAGALMILAQGIF